MAWTTAEMAERVAELLPTGGLVNLGIGMPGAVAAAVDPERGIIFHCENGLVGYRGLAEGEFADVDIVDAASAPVGLVAGAAVVAHDISFAIARGGRLDAAVLGGYQVSARGDLANWRSPDAEVAGVGGAMDLAVGARQVIVMMRHVDRAGRPKIVEACDYPLTARACVDVVVSDLAVLRIESTGVSVVRLAPGVDLAELQNVTAVPLLRTAA